MGRPEPVARRATLLRRERQWWAAGVRRLAGVDEVGVGPLAGPVVAAAVMFPPDVAIDGVDDSKRLTAARREALATEIRAAALAVGVGVVEVAEIDRLNVYRAALEAMRRAVRALVPAAERLLVDARTVPGVAVPQEAIVGGDRHSYSIAAASILAKTERDAQMRALDATYPEYGFARHMGYGTRAHLDALARHGPCPVHRRSFTPVVQGRLPGM